MADPWTYYWLVSSPPYQAPPQHHQHTQLGHTHPVAQPVWVKTPAQTMIPVPAYYFPQGSHPQKLGTSIILALIIEGSHLDVGFKWTIFAQRHTRSCIQL